MSNTRSGRGMKPLYYRSVSSKVAGRPRLTHHHKGGWNETKWMRWAWRNGGMKFVVGETGRNPVKNLPWPRFVHHETHMEWSRRELGTPAVGGERLTACATRPPQRWYSFQFKIFLTLTVNLITATLIFAKLYIVNDKSTQRINRNLYLLCLYQRCQTSLWRRWRSQCIFPFHELSVVERSIVAVMRRIKTK